VSGFLPGEHVRASIDARVAAVGAEGHDGDVTATVQLAITGPDGREYVTTVPAGWSAVAIERTAPKEWPPRPGDLWRRDEYSEVWFAVFDNYGRKLVMLPSNPAKGLTAYEPDKVLARGPLTLVHREEVDA
jgi:hypothetical protein